VRFEKKRADNLLDVVIPMGVELASEKDFNRLLENMVKEAKEFCNAAAGVLYLVTPDQHLKFVIFRDDRQGLALGGTTGQAVPLLPVPLTDPATGEPNRRNIAARTALGLLPINIADAAQAAQFDFAPLPSTDKPVPLSASSWLSLPLENQAHQALGVLQLLDARDRETGQVIPFDASLQQMMMSFSSLAVAALEAYIREQGLRQEIHQLRIEIDEVKRRKQVEEIVESDSFKEIQEKARAMRLRRRENEQGV
jgi:GAF domain-containing protein